MKGGAPVAMTAAPKVRVDSAPSGATILRVWGSTKLAKPWRTSILMPLSAFMASSPRVCSTFLRWASRVAQSRLRPVGADHALVRVLGPVAHEVGGVAPGLGRDAAAPEAFAAGQGGVVDHGHLDAVVGQVAGAVLAAGAAADDGDLDVPVAGGDGG
jgi:hypothetical protein